MSQFREEQITAFTADLEGMKRDQQAVEAHRDRVARGLSNAQARIDSLVAENLSLARQLQAQQLKLTEVINYVAPSPQAEGILGR